LTIWLFDCVLFDVELSYHCPQHFTCNPDFTFQFRLLLSNICTNKLGMKRSELGGFPETFCHGTQLPRTHERTAEVKK